MSSNVRAYVPLTSQHLAAAWPQITDVLAFAPDADGRALRSDAGEEAEFSAQMTAAEACLDEALRTGSTRVVIACDIPALGAQVRPVGAGLEVFGPLSIDPSRVVSFHIDDPEVVAALPDDGEAAAEMLRSSPLLWFDASEVGDLLEAFGQHPLDGGGGSGLDS
ncbi:DUF6912 family protein [Brevibacterium otitidis]|uniref:DUF6912 family protein n=1 Tax=Brevibacterium otitidis TaxID=53364 RepID=A0ABV5X788_9MICO|nr:hypothetical protein GCM10023233_17680 [Brevibacterium otitidis]